MKALIPTAGQGTRLYPQTHTKPKAMVRLAGRPILGHILSGISATDIDEVVIVVGGSMKEQIIEYAESEFGHRFSFFFPEQERAEGLGHSIYQAESAVGSDPMLIALGDMLFESGYETFLEAHRAAGDVSGSIGVKRVDEPHRYGVVERDGDGAVSRLVEKPENPPSEYAISGVYVVEDADSLFESLSYLVDRDVRGAGDEYQLTDALQRMIDRGCSFRTFEVENWYDCGRPETLLEANRVLLSKLETNSADTLDNSVVVPPVDFGTDVTVEASIVGPYVSIDDRTRVKKSIVRNSIVGQRAELEDVNLESSIVGDNSEVHGEANELNVGDNSVIDL